MSIKLMVRVYESALPKNEKAIALKYADFSDDDGQGIFPSVARVAWETGYSDRSVQIITNHLIERGILLHVGHHPSYGTNEYRMNHKALPERPSWSEYISQRYSGGEVSSPPPEETSPPPEVSSPTHRVKSTTSRGAESSPDPLDNLITKEEEDRQRLNAFSVYEQEIGMLSPIVADKLGDLVDTYPEEWVQAAIKEAAVYNKRSLAYVEAILKNWQANGRSANGNGKSNGAPDLWLTDGLPYRVGSKRFTDLDPKSQQAIRQMGGQSVFKAGGQFEETRLRSQFLQLVTVTQ